ncbi:short-chain dehydrogenase [Lujinxingia litoralis]|uniref:Short-chain dehydrogenase n=1 Tax=Lujinxingia litoralis TaxID=2211119 RepID=A0A328CBS6_9DELT|nr:SDR family oxidoreductase [Lujinxingia litoralis]RAL25126.1 short-chain dehydrogenase [Lujinxingia litoralis]
MSVIILGATSPIARAVAERYAEAGYAVALAARDQEEGARSAADLRIRYGVETQAFAFDACDFDSHPDLIARVEDALGPIDVALVAFGFMGDQHDSQSDFAKARRVIDVNYTGAVSVCEALAGVMRARGAGSIVGLSSVAGDRGRASNYFYGSAKGALTLYLQGLRNRLAGEGVHVMTVKLGFVDTPMTFELDTAIPIASPTKAGGAIFQAERQKIETFYYPRFWGGIMGVIKAIPEKVFKRLSL